jgi:hypothetical protein
MNHVFIDTSLGALRAVLWHDTLKSPRIILKHLSPQAPLSDILPSLWSELYVGLLNHNYGLIRPDKVFVLQGPGPLTSLRVLYSNLLALKTSSPQTKFFQYPTPKFIKDTIQLTQKLDPLGFIHQVGRFAFIAGEINDVETYKTHHLRNENDWQTLLSILKDPILSIGLKNEIPGYPQTINAPEAFESEIVDKLLKNFFEAPLFPIQP